MAIVGIESLIYAVDDLDLAARFFIDYGLELANQSSSEVVFELPVGAKVVLKRMDDPSLAPAYETGPGVRETIWGVDTPQALEDLVAGLATDREVRRDGDGSAHFLDDNGLPFGLRLFTKRALDFEPENGNAPGRIQRLNSMRKWYDRARPKTINHVVYVVENYARTFVFFRDRLGFRLTDHSIGLGLFARADGANEHHSIFLAKVRDEVAPAYKHAAFGVENIDEMMVGANRMTRLGWKGPRGLARHRVSSALFYYVLCPAGGEAEYHADTDYMDDDWVPRVWNAMFGFIQWMHDLPDFLMKPAPEEWSLDPESASLDPVLARTVA